MRVDLASFLYLLIGRSAALRILGIMSMPLKSHLMAVEPLFEELQRRGHSVTVLSNYRIDGIEWIDLASPRKSGVRPMEEYEREPKWLHHLVNYYKHVVNSQMVLDDCESLFGNDEAKRIFESRRDYYDVIMVEQFMSDCALAYVAIYFPPSTPVIGLTSHVMLPHTYPKLGLPFRHSSDRFYFASAGLGASTFEKLQSVLMELYFNAIARWQYQKAIESVVKKHIPDNKLNLDEVLTNLRMVFVYQHFTLTGARLLAPRVLEIGGLHVRKPRHLPEDLNSFISASEDGVIYVSFGSMLDSGTMSETKLNEFLAAFQSLKQRIVWRVQNQTLLRDKTTKDIFVKEWMPQLDVLCHDKVVGFVSHGGMLGTSEAIACGVPVVAVPFFGDQFSNSAVVRESGLGRQLHWQDLDRNTLVEAINDITSEERRNHVKVLSRMWHDRPQSPMDAAIFWTEYVAKYKSEVSPPELHSKRTSIWQELLLDVWFLLAGILGAVTTVMFLLWRFVKWGMTSFGGRWTGKLKVQ